eukprot:CAMPEP_0195290632 /NCGR_PEP_ID=MMETSP0707-20130614/6420_1 /TAXON_ID=33640 /ORGANISM="Asterionellopsis glacialis, Strain CCMP134" /LENGTH=760 /DNA_ID=CAMNT_0040350785 /DNA_START=35 /DNA_END=2317 /DNA_ORIENTATION=+
MAPSSNDSVSRKKDFLKLIKKAAAELVAKEDVWAAHDIPSIPAERVIRHRYDSVTKTWHNEETIVKIERESFTHGAMRHCFRMKKMATPPQSSSYHRFYGYGWSRASNYVAKCYMKEDGSGIDVGDQAKDAVRNDVVLQYEAARWADKFNQTDPPHKINFIVAYAIEFPDREGQPWFAVERFIDGKDPYGTGFLKHNTNSGFVDMDEHRITPQAFSAHSFYASGGTRLVADIQGVGDLFTDPQVLSIDYRFGDGDLGPRGMALFFKSFRHSAFSDRLGIPTFQLSRNELKHQAKYSEDEITVSDDDDSFSEEAISKAICRFSRLDLNRKSRMSALITPKDMNLPSDESADTLKRSNLFRSRADISSSLRASFTSFKSSRFGAPPKITLSRTKSDVDEVSQCLYQALQDPAYDHKAFHRKASGEIKERKSHGKGDSANERGVPRRGSIMKRVAPIMIPDEKTQFNIGKVHFHLASLHGMDRFPEIIPLQPDDKEDSPTHDPYTVLFHLCHAASHKNVEACIALARVKAGLDTSVSHLLQSIVPIDFEGSKDLFRRGMESPMGSSESKAAAGCLLYQILKDEETASDITMIGIIEDILDLLQKSNEEKEAAEQARAQAARGGGLHVGDRVEADFALEGTYYPATVTEVSEDGASVVVKYDDDGSTESHALQNVRGNNVEEAQMSSTFGKGMSDEEALGIENDDGKIFVESYVLKAELAEFKAKTGAASEAATLFEEAADGAMNDGKMQTATKWSMQASELLG